ncbi:MAG: orotate phosphoribosyltransferase, partial [Chitinophagaceae bacterium]|nr:orotate phosphoribosyltransferase [Chitinophagaceae bacterium]
GVKHISLTNYTNLITTALEKNMVAANMQTVLLEWRNNPSTWNGLS